MRCFTRNIALLAELKAYLLCKNFFAPPIGWIGIAIKPAPVADSINFSAKFRYYKKAEVALRKAFPQKTRPREARELEATILNNLGLAYFYHESFQSSPKYLREARRSHQNARIIYQELEDKEQEAQQLYNLSLLYDSQHSIELLEEALKILENDVPLSRLLPQIKATLMQRRRNFNIKVE